jgi:poly-gamma-glutamate capsule biosynthesis protein CapA/YwtB (metallophosphatase superfamily)
MRLLAVGDVMLGRLVNEVLKHYPPDYPWGDTLPLFRTADLRLCNLECVLSDYGEPWPRKVFHFRSDAKNVAVLQEAGIELVSIANNHVLDYGSEAMFQMLEILERAHIRWAGAGRNCAEACKPASIEKSGTRVAMIAFTDNEPGWAATEDRPGICHFPDNLSERRAARLLEMVAKARADADFLIVSAHWGPNWGYEPPAEHAALGHALIDVGADLVFGHSPHVFRGIEFHRGKPILYSAGNFIDDYAVDEVERNDESFIFVMDAAAGGVREITLYPTMIRRFQAVQASPAEARRIAQKMQALCEDLGAAAEWSDAERCLKISAAGSAKRAA